MWRAGVARGERGNEDANKLVRSCQAVRSGVGVAARWTRWAGRRGLGGGRASFARGPGGEDAEGADAAQGRSLSRSAQAPRSPPFIWAGGGAACCSDVGSVCAFQNSQTSQECWLARAAAKRLPWLHCTFVCVCVCVCPVKKTVRFFHLKLLLLGRVLRGVMVVMVVGGSRGERGSSSELCLDWVGGRT